MFHVKDDFKKTLRFPAKTFNRIAKFCNNMVAGFGITLKRPDDPTTANPVVVEVNNSDLITAYSSLSTDQAINSTKTFLSGKGIVIESGRGVDGATKHLYTLRGQTSSGSAINNSLLLYYGSSTANRFILCGPVIESGSVTGYRLTLGGNNGTTEVYLAYKPSSTITSANSTHVATCGWVITKLGDYALKNHDHDDDYAAKSTATSLQNQLDNLSTSVTNNRIDIEASIDAILAMLDFMIEQVDNNYQLQSDFVSSIWSNLSTNFASAISNYFDNAQSIPAGLGSAISSAINQKFAEYAQNQTAQNHTHVPGHITRDTTGTRLFVGFGTNNTWATALEIVASDVHATLAASVANGKHRFLAFTGTGAAGSVAGTVIALHPNDISVGSSGVSGQRRFIVFTHTDNSSDTVYGSTDNIRPADIAGHTGTDAACFLRCGTATVSGNSVVCATPAWSFIAPTDLHVSTTPSYPQFVCIASGATSSSLVRLLASHVHISGTAYELDHYFSSGGKFLLSELQALGTSLWVMTDASGHLTTVADSVFNAAVANAGADLFAQKTHTHNYSTLQNATSGTPAKDSTNGALGSSSYAAHADHSHPLNVDTSYTPAALYDRTQNGAAASGRGSSTAYARADHSHPRPDITDLKATIDGHSGDCLLVVNNSGAVTHSGNAKYDALAMLTNALKTALGVSGNDMTRLTDQSQVNEDKVLMISKGNNVPAFVGGGVAVANNDAAPTPSTTLDPSTAAQNNTAWTRDNDSPLAVWQQTRTFYDSSTGKLYGYKRRFLYDKYGLLYSVSGESRYEICQFATATWS